jgi:segregation and condensation protein B
MSGIQGEPDIKELEGIVEGVLFAAGDPVTLDKLAAIIELDTDDARALLSNMAVNLKNSKRGLLVREVDGKYQLSTRPEHKDYISRLIEERPRHNLSQAAYETLSIIAYNSNVTRAAIEKIRGVNSDSSIDKLLERNLIKETGKLNVPGRPMGYDVTDEFFRRFGYASKEDMEQI